MQLKTSISVVTCFVRQRRITQQLSLILRLRCGFGRVVKQTGRNDFMKLCLTGVWRLRLSASGLMTSLILEIISQLNAGFESNLEKLTLTYDLKQACCYGENLSRMRRLLTKKPCQPDYLLLQRNSLNGKGIVALAISRDADAPLRYHP